MVKQGMKAHFNEVVHPYEEPNPGTTIAQGMH